MQRRRPGLDHWALHDRILSVLPSAADGVAFAPMNLLLLRSDDAWLDERSVQLEDQRAQHIRTVLKASVGDALRAGVVGGNLGQAVITAVDDHGVTLTVDCQDPPSPRHRFDIVLALPRPKMLRRVLRTVAEFGVANLHLINSARVEKSYWQSPLLAPSKLEDALLAGMERSSDTVKPQVHQHKLFRPFVEDQLKELCAGRPCWIAQMGSAKSLPTLPGQAVVMVGPEGGFVPFELDRRSGSWRDRCTLAHAPQR